MRFHARLDSYERLTTQPSDGAPNRLAPMSLNSGPLVIELDYVSESPADGQAVEQRHDP